MEDELVIVTGGAQGIGRTCSLVLINEGYKVLVLDNDNEAIEDFKNEMNSNNLYFICSDVSKETDIQNALIKANEISKNIKGLINNAAVAINKPIIDLLYNEWLQVLNVNLTGIFLMCKYFIPDLIKVKGSIVNISSTRALMSEAHTEAYSASKGGVIALTHALAVSYGPDVRVNCISPGWIETRDLKKKSNKEKVVHSDKDKNQHLVNRVGTTYDIAYLITYLISDKAGFITGQNFTVDGGMTKKMIYY